MTAGFVNFIILPPKYFQQIEDNIAISETKTFELFSSRIHELLLAKYQSNTSNDKLSNLIGLYSKIETLIGYQRDELRYHHKMKNALHLKDLTNAHINRLLLITFIKYYIFT